MTNAAAVDLCEGGGGLAGIAGDLPVIQSCVAQEIAQSGAVNELHRDVGLALRESAVTIAATTTYVPPLRSFGADDYVIIYRVIDGGRGANSLCRAWQPRHRRVIPTMGSQTTSIGRIGGTLSTAVSPRVAPRNRHAPPSRVPAATSNSCAADRDPKEL
jgi:hypothetical protein